MADISGHPEKPQGEAGRAMLERMNTGAHEQLANWGLARLEVLPEAQIIDLGCGGGANIARLLAMAQDVFVAGIDYAPLAVNMSREVNAKAIAAQQCTVKAAPVDSLPFPAAAFDLATAFETVYFWPDMSKALAEVHRVLKKDGMLLICNEANGQTEAGREVEQQIEGMKVYTADELRSLLEAAQFEIVEIEDEGETGRMCIVARAC